MQSECPGGTVAGAARLCLGDGGLGHCVHVEL